MRTLTYSLLFVATGCLTGASNAATTDDLFDDADLAPANVDVYVHVADPIRWRRELQDRPIAHWATRMLGAGMAPAAFERLSDAAGLTPERFFDITFGESFTFMARNDAAGVHWVVLTVVEVDVSRQIIKQLNPRTRLGQNIAVFTVPEHQLVLAQKGRLLLVGPEPRSDLFDEVIRNLSAPQRARLGDEPSITKARTLGTGDAAMILRHPPPLGGWSAVVAELDAPKIIVRYAADFANTPFTSPPPTLRWDARPMRKLESQALAVLIEPVDNDLSPKNAFEQVLFGEATVSAELRAAIGPRQITVLSNIDLGLAVPPERFLLPTFSRAIEVRQDLSRAIQMFDDQMIRYIGGMNSWGDGSFEIQPPDLAGLAADDPRRVEVGPDAAEFFVGKLPGLEHISLNWRAVDAPLSKWLVVASHPDQMNRMATTLRQPDLGKELVDQWQHCACVVGQELATQLDSIRMHAPGLAKVGQEAEFADSLLFLSEWSAGFEKCRWRMLRPCENTVRIDAELVLSPPDSPRD